MSTAEQHDSPGRRTVLRAAVAGGAATAAVAAGALEAAPARAAQAAAGHGRFDSDSPRFALAVLPDTQYLFDADSSDPAPLRETFRYLAADRSEANIAFMTHLGDVTEHGTEDEIRRAAQTFRTLHGKVPYSVLAGNHDIASSTDDQRGDSAYLREFGPRRYASMPTFRGSSPDGYNSYHVLRAAGREWLVLALDWRISDKGLGWAQDVLDAHPALPAVLTTHDLAFADEEGSASLSDHGQRLWDDGLIRGNDQIFLALGGHYWPPGRTVLTNDADNDVHIHITNYQDRYYGGAGMIRTYGFDTVRGVIDVETFAPWFLAREPERRAPLEAETVELTGPADRFSLIIDFDARFQGFSPVAAPKPRPASAVMPRGTVAYWRFDADGMRTSPDGGPVADGTVVRDLSGHGNDLTVGRLHSSGPEALTWSPDHHPGQPAHASLRFDGGKAPDRGAALRTGARAPLNSEKFPRGYTIETFVRLPEPFEGDHSWMGILSWEGRNGDAGKTTGWSPLEPTCSLNLSPERFLQFVVYPHRQDADPTSWSHAVPVGRWMHIAVVNDGRRTVMYVDGSKIARNPAAASTGIATLGKPFVLGATGFDELFGQGFYGWIGDTRVVGRPLPTRDFLTPFG